MPLTTEDQLEIRDLLARYCHALDAASDHLDTPRPDLERAWVDTFTEDGVFETGASEWRGRAGLHRFWTDSGQRPPHVRHWINNLVLDGDADSARGRSYLVVYDVSAAPAAPAIRYVGAYDDQLRKVDGRWKIAHRKIINTIAEPSKD